MTKKELYQLFCDEFEYLSTDEIIDRMFNHFNTDELTNFLEFLETEIA